MKKKKRNSVIGLILLLAVMCFLLYTAVFGIGEDQDGSMENIRLGLDLAGGVSITYQAVGDETPSDEDMDDTVYKLQRRVEQYSTEAQVYREGTDRINVEIPGVTDANAILEQLGRPGSLYFIRQKDADGNDNYTLNSSTYQYELASGKTIASLEESGDIVLEGCRQRPGGIPDGLHEQPAGCRGADLHRCGQGEVCGSNQGSLRKRRVHRNLL